MPSGTDGFTGVELVLELLVFAVHVYVLLTFPGVRALLGLGAHVPLDSLV